MRDNVAERRPISRNNAVSTAQWHGVPITPFTSSLTHTLITGPTTGRSQQSGAVPGQSAACRHTIAVSVATHEFATFRSQVAVHDADELAIVQSGIAPPLSVIWPQHNAPGQSPGDTHWIAKPST